MPTIDNITKMYLGDTLISSGGGSREDEIISHTLSGEYTNDRITYLYREAFADNTQLISINLPAVTSMDYGVFSGCENLTLVNLPLVTEISQTAFLNCKNLTSLDFSNITSVGPASFSNSGINITEFPNVVSISGNCFRNCTNLTSVSFPKATSIGYAAFEYCTNLTSVYFPEITTIYGFNNCTFTSISQESFPKATEIGNGAFYDCGSLQTVDFSLITDISYVAFENCTSLTKVILRNTSQLCTLANMYVFSTTPIGSGTGYIYVPDELVESYQVADNWCNYSSQIKPLSELS